LGRAPERFEGRLGKRLRADVQKLGVAHDVAELVERDEAGAVLVDLAEEVVEGRRRRLAHLVTVVLEPAVEVGREFRQAFAFGQHLARRLHL
jgi:hypothetical protein